MKNLLTIIIILTILSVTKAQFRVGVLGGINNPTFKTSGIEANFSEKARPSIRALSDIGVYENLLLEVKMLYHENYSKGTPEGINATYSYESSNIRIPLAVKYEFGKEIVPYISAGISLLYNLKTDLVLKSYDVQLTDDFSHLVKDFSFDTIFSGGLQLNFDKYIVFAEGNYLIGLTNLLKPGVFEVGSA